ncbi:catechol 2,3-dioxygenase-like lactoylglutathione lyase family enzyme [Pedobacter cryoconitis]|uniref:Catechol 2,3-dioxygenase-like lactoylglutathione lyase family enzyme n=1 Tax=Pedobacter cryoconitis TaxID=188932 RepID=A0A7W8ZI80_9SPHI|nr:VOC family protein [Pedobacter cryoconitis]MBB5634383.1 catechol 2,3-dioxygenase-like lactoylglutathione lyase family enzyme [Pedobacter cryoconitis]MBB6272495.1 catechol 2,3-dioxygenase-like lactoylglutathione lyase family enzyme [Pedobacter cryoconitis]
MITGLYETHIYVENLQNSIAFYKNILGLEQCRYEEDRKIAFFWIGKPQEAMLGLWEKPKNEIDKRHFAFRCDKEYILNESVDFLKAHDLKPYNFLKNGSEQPMVFAWMPAVAIYFLDPDGHQLEFISILEGNARPELGVISFEEWERIKT